MCTRLVLSFYLIVSTCFGLLQTQSFFDDSDFRCEERRDKKIAAKLQSFEVKIKALEGRIQNIDLKNQQGELNSEIFQFPNL